MSLIETILVDTKARLAERKSKRPVAELRSMIHGAARAPDTFANAIRSKPFSIIAEVKRRSPSSGRMDETNVQEALGVYDATASVSAVSILTDEDHFGSGLEDLRRARAQTTKPLLRKDFIIDEYQVFEARAFGADAILIMSGLHSEDAGKAAGLIELARSLGMDVLFEIGMMHAGLQEQQRLIRGDAVVWGVNSRRFNTSRVRVMSRVGSLIGKELSTDISVHAELRSLIPEGQLAVAESGINAPAYLSQLRSGRYNAALIGTAFLKKGVKVSEVVGAFDQEIASHRSTLGGPRHASGFPVPTG
jgi:indole-3-glycerol phosphate synthase